MPLTERGRAWRALAVRQAVFLLCGVSVLASALIVWAYWFDWGTQWLGFAMGLALGALGVALVAIAHRVLPGGTYVEAREPLASPPEEQLAFELDLARDGTLARRKFVWLGLAGAFGAFALAGLAPIRSLGTRPDRSLRHTPWGNGVRAVNVNGQVVRATDIPVGGTVVVFPESVPGSAEGQAVLIRVGADVAASAKSQPQAGDVYAYSNLCTHMACPLGQYMAQSHQLMCPCHQSIFEVLDNGRASWGPAGRDLPTLPIAIDADGVVVARGDFSAPVGASFWSLG